MRNCLSRCLVETDYSVAREVLRIGDDIEIGARCDSLLLAIKIHIINFFDFDLGF